MLESRNIRGWERFLRVRPLTPVASLIWVGLTALGYFGNVASLPLFFNVDFLFGSTVVFIVIHYYGWGPGTITALIASFHTMLLWQHPYAIVILTLEGLIVGVLYRRYGQNFMFLDTLFWLLIGMPLVIFFYGAIMGVAEQSTILVVFKQAINGIVNALFASLIIGVLQHFFPELDRRAARTPYTFSQAIVLVMVAFVILPAMAILIVTARAEMNRVEEDVESKLEITSFSTRQAVNAWISENLQTLGSLATYAETDSPDRLQILRAEMALLNMSDADFSTMAVVDPQGHVIASEPAVSADLRLAGVDLTTTTYFAQLTTGLEGAASDVIGDGGSSIVLLGVPIVEKDQVTGAVLGIVDVQRLHDVLARLSGNWKVDATLVDGNDRVVASTSANIPLFGSFRSLMPVPREHEHDNLYIRLPELHHNVSIMQQWQSSQYMTHDRIGMSSGWSVILEAPIAPYQDALNSRYQTMMLVMLAVIVGTILLSATFSRRMLASLTQLTVVAKDLPQKVTTQNEIDWPTSRINEIDSLIESFRVTSSHLGESFATIQEANAQLYAAKQEAEAASRTKSEFLANISHDLRTPLNGILGYAQILSRDTSLDQRTRDAVGIIEKSGNHLLNLINDILDVSRIEAQKLVLVPESFRLLDFLTDIADIVSLQARQKGLEIHTEFDSALPAAVMGDEKRLRQILLNLLNNAVKFTERGSVTFRAHPADGGRPGLLVFEVEDTGIGIPADQLDEIFSPFKQLSKHIQSEEGTGLGLAIVKRLVAMMDGEVGVQSVPGEGSRFRVTLALGESSGAPLAPRPVSSIVGYEGPRRRVVVVDDKWENRSVLRAMLEPLGFLVFEAGDGAEGIETIRREHAELVFMDLVMPVMDGFEAIRELRAESRLASVRVVAVSASVADSIRNECIRVGFDDFLPKPFRQFELLETVRRLVGVVWVHDTAPRPVAVSEEKVVIPPPELLHAVEEQVIAGNIRRIVDAAEAIRRADERFAAVADRIGKMAREFEINHLADYINELLRDSVEDDA